MNIVQLDIDRKEIHGKVEDMLFGFNLEITRETWFNGISAELINNRKFYRNEDGSVPGWVLLGGVTCSERGIEIPAGAIDAGIRQVLTTRVRTHRRGLNYRIRFAGEGDISVSLIVGNSNVFVGSMTLDIAPVTIQGRIVPETDDKDVVFEVIANSTGSTQISSVSLIPEDGVINGLRADVIAEMKALQPACLRFPGGCYAEYYDWKQGLLDPDERPLISIADNDFLRGIVLGPTYGQDPQDINIDDFVTVCRLVGAEPQFTVRVSENKPEDAAKLVEYTNTGKETAYGRLRISRGYREPFAIKRWYIGNELWDFGRGGITEPKRAAERTVSFARAMKAVDPSIELIMCNRAGTEWNRTMMAEIEQLSGSALVSLASLHYYLLDSFKVEPSTRSIEQEDKDGLRQIEQILKAPTTHALPRLREARNELNAIGGHYEKLPISYDEWNYCWGCDGHPVLAMYTAGVLNQFVRYFKELNLAQALYFHPINEGVIRVEQNGVTLEDGGLVWKLISRHRSGIVVGSTEYPADSPADAAVSIHGETLYMTLINRDIYKPLKYIIPLLSNTAFINVEAYSIDRIWEHAYCASSMIAAEVSISRKEGSVILPPSCVAGIWACEKYPGQEG